MLQVKAAVHFEALPSCRVSFFPPSGDLCAAMPLKLFAYCVSLLEGRKSITVCFSLTSLHVVWPYSEDGKSFAVYVFQLGHNLPEKHGSAVVGAFF